MSECLSQACWVICLRGSTGPPGCCPPRCAMQDLLVHTQEQWKRRKHCVPPISPMSVMAGRWQLCFLYVDVPIASCICTFSFWTHLIANSVFCVTVLRFEGGSNQEYWRWSDWQVSKTITLTQTQWFHLSSTGSFTSKCLTNRMKTIAETIWAKSSHWNKSELNEMIKH